MKKTLFTLSMIGLLVFISCTTTRAVQAIDEITNLDDGTYHIAGKYNNFSFKNEDEVTVLQKHQLVLNAKYNFLKDVPHFVDYEIFYPVYWDREKKHTVTYITNEKETRVIYQQILVKDFLIIVESTQFTDDEWHDFEGYLKDLKQLRATEFEDYKKKQEVKALEEQKKIKEHYKFEDLVDYMVKKPGSTLPNEGCSFYVSAPGSFYIEDANIDGNGVDYLCSYAGQYGLIYIYGENLETMPSLGKITFHSLKPFSLTYTGKTALALSKYGNRVEVPIFIAQ